MSSSTQSALQFNARGRGRLGRWSLPWASDCSWRTQLALFLLAYGLYTFARWVFVGDLETAKEHAHWIVEVEEGAGVAIESSVQEALGSGISIWLLNSVYLAAQLIVIPAALIYTYRQDRGVYLALRNTLLVAWLIAIPVYALFPVAPPRLAEIGLIDTVSDQTGVEFSGRSSMFYNPLAAVPSLHAGFAVAIGIALALVVARPWLKLLAVMWGPIVMVAVVATGNHFVFDIAAGLVVMCIAMLAAAIPALLRRGAPAPQAGALAGGTSTGSGTLSGTRRARARTDRNRPLGV